MFPFWDLCHCPTSWWGRSNTPSHRWPTQNKIQKWPSGAQDPAWIELTCFMAAYMPLWFAFVTTKALITQHYYFWTALPQYRNPTRCFSRMKGGLSPVQRMKFSEPWSPPLSETHGTLCPRPTSSFGPCYETDGPRKGKPHFSLPLPTSFIA